MKTIKQIITVVAITIFMLNAFTLRAQSFDKAGIDHNNVLRKVLPKIDYSLKGNNLIIEIKNKVIKELPTQSNEINSFFMGVNNLSIFDNPQTLLSELNKKQKLDKELYDLVLNTLNRIQTKSKFVDVQGFISIEKNKKRTLSKKSDKMYLDFLSTLKHSVEFWAKDGENGSKYITLPSNSTYPENKKSKGGPNSFDIETYETTLVINWWKVAGCDAVGAIFSAGNAGVAVIASACSAINQY